MKLVVAISGASGANYTLSFLKELKKQNIEVHLIISKWAKKVIEHEMDIGIEEFEKLAFKVYKNDNLSASTASSSFIVDGMIILPASVKTCSEVANGLALNLISRTSENILRMRKKLIICPRETPLSSMALKNLYELSLHGAIVFPLMPAFYQKPKTISDLENFICGKILDLLNIENNLFKRWEN